MRWGPRPRLRRDSSAPWPPPPKPRRTQADDGGPCGAGPSWPCATARSNDLVERAARILSAELPDSARPRADRDRGRPSRGAGGPRPGGRRAVAPARKRRPPRRGLARVRVKLEPDRSPGRTRREPGAFVRVDILFPREEITEEDLHTDEESIRRRDHRRADLATAEQLLQANGGRLVTPPPGTGRAAALRSHPGRAAGSSRPGRTPDRSADRTAESGPVPMA